MLNARPRSRTEGPHYTDARPDVKPDARATPPSPGFFRARAPVSGPISGEARAAGARVIVKAPLPRHPRRAGRPSRHRSFGAARTCGILSQFSAPAPPFSPDESGRYRVGVRDFAVRHMPPGKRGHDGD